MDRTLNGTRSASKRRAPVRLALKVGRLCDPFQGNDDCADWARGKAAPVRLMNSYRSNSRGRLFVRLAFPVSLGAQFRHAEHHPNGPRICELPGIAAAFNPVRASSLLRRRYVVD